MLELDDNTTYYLSSKCNIKLKYNKAKNICVIVIGSVLSEYP